MVNLTDYHGPVADCDCRRCAIHERDRLKHRVDRIENAARNLIHLYRTTCGSLISTVDALEQAIKAKEPPCNE